MPTDLSALSTGQLRALERRFIPLTEWTDEELEQQERALRSAAAAQSSRADLTMGETLQAIGQGAGAGLSRLGRAVANEPIVRESMARFTPSRETVATGLDTLPGPAAGAATFLTGYGIPATAAMTGVAAAAGRDAANRLRGVSNGVAEPLAYGAAQALGVAVPAMGRVTSPAFAAGAPRLAAAAELGAQMGAAGAAGTGATIAYQGASGQELDWKEALKAGGVTALLGGIGGGLRAHEVTKLAAADRDGLIMQARKLGFEGKTFDEMRAWYKEAEDAADILQKGRQQNARPVGANAPAEEGAMVPTGQIQPLADAPAPAAPIVPRAPVPIAPVATMPPAPAPIVTKPVAQMTDAELVAAEQALAAPAAAAPAPGGDLFGDVPFNLASEEQRAAAAPVAPAQQTAEMFGAEVRTTAPTKMDRANQATRAETEFVNPPVRKPPEMMSLGEAMQMLHLPSSPLSFQDVWFHTVREAIKAGRPINAEAVAANDGIAAAAKSAGYMQQGRTYLPPDRIAAPGPAALPQTVAANGGPELAAPAVSGVETVAPAVPEVHTVYDVKGRAQTLPADQPPPAGMVTADQWAELAPLKAAKPERFRAEWSRTLAANVRLAKAAARSEAAPISGRVSNEWKRPFAGHPIRGTTDIIDHIMDAGGIPRPGKDSRGGEFNGFKDAFQGSARRLIAPGEGGGWDTWTQDLASRASRPELERIDPAGLAREVDLALADRNRAKGAGRIEQQEARFYQAATGQARGANPGAEIQAQQLPRGSTLKLGREPFKVSANDPQTGAVTLVDGPKYGTQIVYPGQTLRPDKGSVRGPDGKALKVAKVQAAAPSAEDENPFDPGAGAGRGVAGDPANPAMPPPPPGTPVAAHADQRMPVTLTRIMPGTVDVPTVMAALENVVRVVGGRAPIRSGRFGQDARGVYLSGPDVIRLDRIDNIPTAAHEVAHAISMRLFGSFKSTALELSLRSSPGARAAIRELRALGHALYGNRKPVAGYTAEGFSELLRLWLTTEDAAKKAPAATKWLETELLANRAPLATALRDARGLIDLWRGQGAQGRARAQMKAPPGRLAELVRTIRRNLSREAQVEEFAPLAALRDGYRATTGRRLSPSADPYELASSVRMTAGPVLETMVERGMVDLWGNIVGPGLKESLTLIKPGQAEDFKHYLWARRAIERWSKGKNPGMAPEDATFLRTALETPDFVTSAAKYYQWWDGVLGYLESASPATNGPLVSAIRKGSKDFVPLARELDPNRVRSAAAGAGGNSLKRMLGSGLPVKELYLQSLLSAEKMIAQAHRDLVLDSVLNLSAQPGMGWLVEEVPITRVMETLNVEHIRSQLAALGVDVSAVPNDTLLTYASHLDTPRGVDPIVRRMVGGQPRWFQIPADLFELLQGIEQPQRLGLAFELFLGGPNRMFKLGVTGLNASFSMVTNPARDFPTFILQSIAGNPATRVLAYGRSLAAIVRAALGGKESPELALFNQLGITASNYLGGDIQQAKRAAKGLFHGKLWRVLRTPLESTRELFGFTESVPRFAEMTLLAAELGWQPGQKLTPNQAVALRNAAARVTTDFRAAGSLGRQANRALPFYNAAIQGMRSAARAFKSDQGTRQIPYRWLKTLLTGASILTLPAIYNWWANKDEEWYKMLPWRERWLYLNVEKDGTVFQIPLAPDWGSAFVTLPVALLDSWYQDDPDSLKQAFAHILTLTNPVSMPVLAATAKEQFSNHVSFFDRPIIPRGELDLMPGSQRSPYSSWLAKTLGDVFPGQISPRRVDAALRSTFGGVAGSVADAPATFQRALGLTPDDEAVRESEPADVPVLGKLFRHGGTYTANNQALIDYWDDLNRYSAWKASNNRALKAGQAPLQPMSFKDQAYAMRLEQWQPVLQIALQLAARTPELEKRQALYKRAAEQARRVVQARPPAP